MGRNWFNFEPPLSGPAPIVSKLIRADGTQNLDTATVGDYTDPILTAEAADAVRVFGETELSGTVSPTPHDQCWPEPTPFTLTLQLGVQIVQAKDEVVLFYLADHQVRHIRMNAAHPASVVPSWKGDSVGHYEGDTLVIDTIGQKVGPLSIVDMYGTPFSPALHVVERYRLIDGEAARAAQLDYEASFFPGGGPSPLTNEYGRGIIDPDTSRMGLQVEITVDDPVMFTAPWSGLVTYRPVLEDWPEAVCAENTRELGPERMPPIDETPDF